MKRRRKRITIIIITILILMLLCYPFTSRLHSQRLIKAIRDEDIDKVEAILESGVDPNRTDVPISKFWYFVETSAQRPLSVACETHNYEIIQLLLKYGATTEYVEDAGPTPLMSTVWTYHSTNLEIVKLLLQHGADPSTDFSDSQLPVFVAAYNWPKNFSIEPPAYDEEIAKNITETVILLLGDSDINITTYNGDSLLHNATQKQNLYLVEYLINAGCDTTLRNNAGKTALDYALETQNEKLIALFDNQDN